MTTSHPAPYTRRVAVYVPRQYVPGSVAPFIVGADGPDPLLPFLTTRAEVVLTAATAVSGSS